MVRHIFLQGGPRNFIIHCSSQIISPSSRTNHDPKKMNNYDFNLNSEALKGRIPVAISVIFAQCRTAYSALAGTPISAAGTDPSWGEHHSGPG
jgi:hypothetical protein